MSFLAKVHTRALVVTSVWTISALGQVYDPVLQERPPQSITQLPLAVRKDLARRQCLIPKYQASTSAYAKGHFISRNSFDFAAVCHISAEKTQQVLVYTTKGHTWEGEVIDRTSYDPAPEEEKCWLTVDIANAKYILDHARAYAPEELKHLPPLDHDGVNVGVCDKASIVYFFNKGEWLQLAGAD